MPTYNGRELDSTDYRDADVLEWLYWDEGLSTHEMGDVFNVDHKTIIRWMDRHDIERRNNRTPGATYYLNAKGRCMWAVNENGKTQNVSVQRLTAVAEYGFDAVCDSEVHHKNGIPWDNRPENLQPLSVTEHKRLHADSHPFTTKLLIMELAHNENMKRREIAEAIGVPTSTVCSIAAGQGMGGVNA